MLRLRGLHDAELHECERESYSQQLSARVHRAVRSDGTVHELQQSEHVRHCDRFGELEFHQPGSRHGEQYDA